MDVINIAVDRQQKFMTLIGELMLTTPVTIGRSRDMIVPAKI